MNNSSTVLKIFYILLFMLIAFTFSGCECPNKEIPDMPDSETSKATFRAWKCGQIPDYFLWNLPLFWWGRIGEILQTLGGLLAVADLIGKDRLVGISKKLGDYDLFNKSLLQLDIARNQFLFLIFFFGTFIAGFFSKRLYEMAKQQSNKFEIKAGKAAEITGSLSTIPTLYYLIVFVNEAHYIDEFKSHLIIIWDSLLIFNLDSAVKIMDSLLVLIAILFFFWLVFSIIFLITLAIFSGVTIIILIVRFIIGISIAVLILDPLIYIVGHRKNEEILKIIALFLVLFGSILNLVAT